MRTTGHKAFILILAAGIIAACSHPQETSSSEKFQSSPNASYNVVLKSEVNWDYLNPKRGDLAPMAGTLWGDRKGTEPTGFLLKPTDGFSSPPHIHNVSYRGIVISGVIHNDDTHAANMWMPSGSFWTQPKGEVHITSAEGTNTLAYIEIEEGPYLVLPEHKAFDSGERPLNIDHSNIVWVGASEIIWIDQPGTLIPANEPKVAFLWGKREKGELNGTLVKLPIGFKGAIQSHGSSFRAVIIQGQAKHQIPGKPEIKSLEAGSYFSSKGKAKHIILSDNKAETIVYVRTDGKFDVITEKLE